MPSTTFSIGSDLSGLEHEWKRLFDESGCPNPFLSWEWHQSWAESQHERIHPLLAVDRFPDGRLAAVLPLQEVRHRGLRQWELLSQGSGADELDCLVHPQAREGTPQRLIEAALSLRWHVCRWEAISQHSHLAAFMHQRATQAPGSIVMEAGETLPYLPLPEQFDVLLAQHSANFRSEIRRRRRNLERHGGPVRLHIATSAEEIATAMNLLFTLHNQRRQQKQGAGAFEEESLCQFHRLVARRLAGKRMTRVYVLQVSGTSIAALYGFETRQRFYYFQSGWDPQWSRLSPGTVMLSMVVEDCILRGLRQFEFLRGTEEYKARWTDKSRPTLNVLAARDWLARIYIQSRRLWKYGLGPLRSQSPEIAELGRRPELALHSHSSSHGAPARPHESTTGEPKAVG